MANRREQMRKSNMSRNFTRQAGTLRPDERGQMAFLMVLTLPVLSIFMALVVDVGVWFLDHRVAQNQVDAAALAAVQDLPAANTTQATATVDNWLTKNGSGPEDISCLEYSDRNGDGLFDTVRVCIERQSPGFFSTLSGIPFVYVGAGAVATVIPGQQPSEPYAIFANHDCPDASPAVQGPGSVNIITGGVHSNCDLMLNGSSNTVTGPVTFVGDVTVPGSGNVCNGSPCELVAVQVSPVSMPINYTFADVPCDYTGVEDLRARPQYWRDSGLTRLKDGVYCNETGKLTLSGGGVEGNVTLVAAEIDLSGSDYTLTPYWNDILLFATSNEPSAVVASGSEGSWTGIIYAPNGEAQVAGSAGLSLVSSIIADTVVLSGSNFSIKAIMGAPAGTGTPQIALVE